MAAVVALVLTVLGDGSEGHDHRRVKTIEPAEREEHDSAPAPEGRDHVRQTPAKQPSTAGVPALSPTTRSSTPYETTKQDTTPRKPAERILFATADGYATMNADGSNVQRLTPEIPFQAIVDWAPGGKRLVYESYGSIPGMFVRDLSTGKEQTISGAHSGLAGLAWSPDGRRIAIAVETEFTKEIWVTDADGRNLRFVTFGILPSWSPDGMRLAFECESESQDRGLCTVNSDGSDVERIPNTTDLAYPDWSPDGTMLAAQGDSGTALVRLDGTIERTLPIGYGRWSRDGSYLVGVRNPQTATFVSGGPGVCLPDPCETYFGIWRVDRDGSDLRRLTTVPGQSPQFAR